jgi:hypothetical protein
MTILECINFCQTHGVTSFDLYFNDLYVQCEIDLVTLNGVFSIDGVHQEYIPDEIYNSDEWAYC